MRRALKSKLSKIKLGTEAGAKQGSQAKGLLHDDLRVCSELEHICAEFCRSIQHTMMLFVGFWEFLQRLDSEWFEGDADIGAQVWALRMGLNATATPAFQELLHNKAWVAELSTRLRDIQRTLHARDSAWVERQHYEQKVQSLRSSLSEQVQCGKEISAEQLELLQRNERKRTESQEVLDSVQQHLWSAAEIKADLKTAFQKTASTITQGWFINTGAAVCSALARSKAGRSRGDRGSGSGGATASPRRQNSQALPPHPPEAPPSEEENFDPSAPFSAEWRCDDGLMRELTLDEDQEEGLDDSSPACGSAPSAAQTSAQTWGQLESSAIAQWLSDEKLRGTLSAAGIPAEEGTSREELVRRLIHLHQSGQLGRLG